jgi:hypothetical protein
MPPVLDCYKGSGSKLGDLKGDVLFSFRFFSSSLLASRFSLLASLLSFSLVSRLRLKAEDGSVRDLDHNIIIIINNRYDERSAG